VVYAILAEGRDEQQMRELELALAPDEETRQKTIEKANMEAMKALQSQLGGLAPPRRR
jgi:hypothetical protein